MTEPSRAILPRPDGVRAFDGPGSAGIADCTPSGRVRLDALARWLQDIAYADVLDAGLESVAVWVVRRTRIRVNRWPRFAERFELTTFCSGLGRMWAERRTDVVRSGAEAPDVEAVSLWVHLHPERRLPFPLTETEVSAYSGPEAQRRVTARLRHPLPPASCGVGSEWRFRATESDLADHINNAAYWQPLEEELLQRDAEPGPVDIELEYRAPAQPGVKRWLAEGEARWIVGGGQAGGEAELHASFLLRP
ncbi:MAG: acyl-ACP thioesterase domain-containing protein [Solirubrobacteraceae bacterium]